MQRKTVLSACIALALSGQGWAADSLETDDIDGTRKSTKVTCPAHPEKLSKSEQLKLPPECLEHNNNLALWMVAAGTAAVTTFAIVELNDDGHHHSDYVPPTPPDDDVIPPDDGGDDVVPPDDGGDDVVPPDDGGGDDVVPPDDGGGDDVVPPDDGDDDVVPPDGGDDDDVVPPDDGDDDDVVPPDGGDDDDVVPPDDGDDDDVVPPDDGDDDDGGNTPTPTVREFENNVTWDETNKKLTIRDAEFTVSKNSDGTYTLIAADGRSTLINGWQIDEENNTIYIDGVNISGNMDWQYDNDGILHITKNTPVTIDDPADTITIHFDYAIITDKGGNTALNGTTLMEITGNHLVINNDGDSVATGEGSIIGSLTGDYITVNNNGNTTVDGGTAAIINGDYSTINNVGDLVVTNGGTGSSSIGDHATVDNTGKMNIDGAGSVGTKVVGDDAIVKQKGDLYVSGGAHGIDVTGDRATIVNISNITVTDPDSIGVLLDGNNATFATAGNIDVSNSGTGINISGDNNGVALAGNMKVGDSSTGMIVNGDNNTISLVTSALDVTGQVATGVDISGSGNAITLSGNVVVDKDQTAADAAEHFYDASTGINVVGSDNTIQLDGSLTVVVDSETTTRQKAQYDGSQEANQGLMVSGDGNTIYLNGGVQFKGEQNAMGAAGEAIANNRSGINASEININSLINVDGHSSVYLDGDSAISGDLPLGVSDIINLSNGAYLEIKDGTTFRTDGVTSVDAYWQASLTLINAESGSTVVNNGDVDITNAGFIFSSDSNVVNNGSITRYLTNVPSASTDAVYGFSGAILYSQYGSTTTNNGEIVGKVMSQESVVDFSEDNINNDYALTSDVVSITGIYSGNKSSAINDKGATIDLYGRGVVGMFANYNSTINNAGKITIRPLWVDENDTSSLNSNIPSSKAMHYGAGMEANDTSVATNLEGGTITVYNAGAGMVGNNAGTVINQGTINLEQDEDFDSTLADNTFVGIAVYDRGTAINDQTGVININAQNGKAFYNDGTGIIINYGTICTFGVCQQSDEYNPSDDNVSYIWKDGDIITQAGESLVIHDVGGSKVESGATVTNAGSVSDGRLIVQAQSHLINEETGTIASAVNVNGGTFTNNGIVVGGGTEGDNLRIMMSDGTFNNNEGGTVSNGAELSGNSVVNNAGDWMLGDANSAKNADKLQIKNASVFNNTGSLTFVNGQNAIHLDSSGTLYNTGEMTFIDTFNDAAINYWGMGSTINNGTITATGKRVAYSESAVGTDGAYFWNQQDGVIDYNHANGKVVEFTKANYYGINDGTINVNGNNAVAMAAGDGAQMVNGVNGVINLGYEGTTDTGMVAMQLNSGATADAVIENNGTINIYANNSYAFSKLGPNGRVVNNGTVNFADGVTGSGIIKQNGVTIEGDGDGGNGTETHYASDTRPDEPGQQAVNSASTDGTNDLTGYVVGTNDDGSAGKLMVNNASMDGVSVNAGFASGTDATTMTFNDVVQGENLTDASAITSTTVVWNAQGSQDVNGNIDVTMTKNAYTDVATDASVNSVAQALDAGYTNNELYTSLNVGTTAELNSALKQISGSQATTVFREARVLSNRFSMLADAAPQMSNGLAFNVVAKGDPRAELGNDTQYDMLALRKSLELTEHQSLSLEYGIARLDGNGSDTAGDNGVTGGYSQFFGLKHQMAFDGGISWNNALRYDVHNLDSSRSVAYGGVNKTADTEVKQQYLEFRSEGAKTFELNDTLKVTPYAGVKLRHTLEDGYQERNAGDFNLNMNSGSETAVDSIVGLKLDYTGKNGWSANATLEGGPNLSYSKSQRSATLTGAGDQRFNVDDGQQGGGVNSLATVGVKYSSNESSLNLDAYHWKEDNISDKGVMLKFKKTF
ncbi:autotransporter domain-containing protein [Escherichia coli]|nr:autotransporter domain-containing protein [Escherichia coli]